MIELLRFPAAAEQRLAMRREIELISTGPRVVLETCDRLEIYRGEGPASPEVQRHLVRVAAGLESPLVGEKAVMGQVRSAFAVAGEQGTLSKGLHRLFQDSIGIARRIRQSSGIDRGAVGHGQAVAEILRESGRPQTGELVLIIGINELTAGIIRFLMDRTDSNFILANRNFHRARDLADRLGIEARSLGELGTLAPHAGVIISGTSAPHLLIHSRHFANRSWQAGSAKPRACLPTLLFDLASPPDIDPALGNKAGFQLWGLAEVEAHARRNLATRQTGIRRAELILEGELAKLSSRGMAGQQFAAASGHHLPVLGEMGGQP